MSDKIKTREGVKNIKIIDKAESAAKKMKNAYIRTKDEVQQSQQTENDSPSEYATDNATRSAENVVYKTGFQVKKQTGKIIDKVKDTHNIKNKVDSVAEPIKEQAKKHTEQNIRNATQSAKHATGKTIKSVPKGEKTIKQPVKATNKAFKTTLKGTIKKVPKTIKNTERTAKATIKSSQHAAKVAVKTAQATAKASKAAIKSARAAAKVAIRTTKMTVKATIAAIKAIIAAVKGLVSLIAAGGWIAVVIIIVICMVAFILFSGFGIFFSNEQPNSQGYTIKQVIYELNSEYSNKIEEVQTDNPHDIVVYNSPDGLLPQIKWDEVLAVYSVKTLMDPDNPTELVTVDDSKKEILRNVFWDMNKITQFVSTVENEIVAISVDEEGNEVTTIKTISQTVLTIKLTRNSYTDMISMYSFNAKQQEQLKLLMADEYKEMWEQLLGNNYN